MIATEKKEAIDELLERLDNLYKTLGIPRPYSQRFLREQVGELHELAKGIKNAGKPAIMPSSPPPVKLDAPPPPKAKGEKP